VWKENHEKWGADDWFLQHNNAVAHLLCLCVNFLLKIL